MWPFFIRKRRLTAIGVPVFIWLVCATSAAPKNEFVSAEGVVVAIQGGKTDTRLIEPASFADLAEIYMVRVDRWSQPRKEKYILVEYIHHADLIRYDEFDKTRWNFEIHQASPEETRDCLSWMVREGSFHPTAFGAKAKLPDPKGLTCFLMEKRPLVVSERVDFVIDENKPFVYVRFDHVGTGEQRSEDESTSRIWLRIVNNCRFPIVLRTTGVPDESPKEEVGVMYEVAANPVTQGMVILSRPPTSGQSTPLTGNENEKPLAKSEST